MLLLQIRCSITYSVTKATSKLTARYFPEYGISEAQTSKKLIQNSFNVKPADVPDNIQEETIELQIDCTARTRLALV